MSNIFEKLAEKEVEKKGSNDNDDDTKNDKETHLTKKELRAQDKELRETYGDVVEKDNAPKQHENRIKPNDDWASGEKRPYDRHSANTNSNAGAPRELKKQGHGKGNVGNIKEQIEEGLAGENDDEDYEEAQDGTQGDEQNNDKDKSRDTAQDNKAGNEQGQEGQNQQNKDAASDIITADQYLKSTGVDYAFLHENKEGKEEGHTAHVGKIDDPNLRAHVQKSKDHPEYHKKAKDPDAIFTPSTNIADPTIPDEPEKKDDENKQDNVNEDKVKKELDEAGNLTGDNQNTEQQQNQGTDQHKSHWDNQNNQDANKTDNQNNQDVSKTDNKDKQANVTTDANKTDNKDKQTDVAIDANKTDNKDKQTDVATDANNNKADDKKIGNEDNNITAINNKDDSLGSANEQNKTVNDIISELDQDKDKNVDKQTAHENLAAKDTKPVDQTLSDATQKANDQNATDTTLNRGFIEESMNKGDTSNLPPIEKQTSPTPSTITQHDSVNEKGDKDAYQVDLTTAADKENNEQQNNANKKFDEQDALEKMTTQSEPNFLDNDLKQNNEATALDKKDALADEANMKKKDNEDITGNRVTDDTYKA